MTPHNLPRAGARDRRAETHRFTHAAHRVRERRGGDQGPHVQPRRARGERALACDRHGVETRVGGRDVRERERGRRVRQQHAVVPPEIRERTRARRQRDEGGVRAGADELVCQRRDGRERKHGEDERICDRVAPAGDFHGVNSRVVRREQREVKRLVGLARKHRAVLPPDDAERAGAGDQRARFQIAAHARRPILQRRRRGREPNDERGRIGHGLARTGDLHRVGAGVRHARVCDGESRIGRAIHDRAVVPPHERERPRARRDGGEGNSSALAHRRIGERCRGGRFKNGERRHVCDRAARAGDFHGVNPRVVGREIRARERGGNFSGQCDAITPPHEGQRRGAVRRGAEGHGLARAVGGVGERRGGGEGAHRQRGGAGHAVARAGDFDGINSGVGERKIRERQRRTGRAGKHEAIAPPCEREGAGPLRHRAERHRAARTHVRAREWRGRGRRADGERRAVRHAAARAGHFHGVTAAIIGCGAWK